MGCGSSTQNRAEKPIGKTEADGNNEQGVTEGPPEPVLISAMQLCQCDNLLGEAPMWNQKEGSLYWLDINGKKLWCWNGDTGDSNSWDLPEVAGSFAFREKGGFIMGFESGLARYDPAKGTSEQICEYEPDLNTRPNDGKCDRQGNFVIGSYNKKHREDQQNIAGLWRLKAGSTEIEEILDYRFRCSNTTAFTEKGDKMYFCDTPTREIYRFDYNGKKSGTQVLTNKTLFYTMTEEDQGGPDGATVDAQGGVWEAQAGNWRVVRHRPSDGAIDYIIKLPFNNPSSCCIGGEKFDRLFISTARHRLSEEERQEQPGAGQLWAAQLPDGIRGFPETWYKG